MVLLYDSHLSPSIKLCISLATSLFALASPTLCRFIGFPSLIIDRTTIYNFLIAGQGTGSQKDLCAQADATRESGGQHLASSSMTLYEVHAQLPSRLSHRLVIWSEFESLKLRDYTTPNFTPPRRWSGYQRSLLTQLLPSIPTKYTGVAALFVRSSTSSVRRSAGARTPKYCRQKGDLLLWTPFGSLLFLVNNLKGHHN